MAMQGTNPMINQCTNFTHDLSHHCVLIFFPRTCSYSHVGPAGDKINTFMMSFTDGRDSDMLLVSHFSLLTGMAVPVWLSTVTTTPTTTRRDMTDLVQLTGRDPFQLEPLVSNSSVTALPLTAFAGIMILGIADSAASAIGKKYGRHRICVGTSKTLEGTLGATLLTLLGWALLAIVFQGNMSNSVTAAHLVLCLSIACCRCDKVVLLRIFPVLLS